MGCLTHLYVQKKYALQQAARHKELPALVTIKVETKGSLGNLGTMGKHGKVEIGAGELAQLWAAVLGEDLSPAPSTYVRNSQLPVTSAPGEPMPLASMGTCT